MGYLKNLSGRGKAGFLIFLVVNASFIFLLVSPYVPNLIGEYLDEQLLVEANIRIQQNRVGPVQIHLQYANGTTIQGWNISFNHIRHEFIFGCNAYAFESYGNTTLNDLYKTYFKQLFNTAVIGFYWVAYEPTQGYFPRDSYINSTINWCEQNNITPKGHPLAWARPSGKPDWLPLENDTLIAELLENRITNIVTNYSTRIDFWDVVNEPAHTETFAGMSRVEYVRNCLVWANTANPSTHLTVNDYGILGHDFGFGPYYNLLSELVSLNAPFDSIGFQLHEPRTDWVPATEIWATMDAFAQLGKAIHITEFCPVSASVPITNSWKKGMWSEENQAEYARRVYTVLFSHPACEGIIWWDLEDSRSWLQNGGLIRDGMTPKPVYNVLDQLINHEWRTSGSQFTNSLGNIQFSGFYGIYNISVQNGAYSFLINVKAGASNQFTLTI